MYSIKFSNNRETSWKIVANIYSKFMWQTKNYKAILIFSCSCSSTTKSIIPIRDATRNFIQTIYISFLFGVYKLLQTHFLKLKFLIYFIYLSMIDQSREYRVDKGFQHLKRWFSMKYMKISSNFNNWSKRNVFKKKT